MGEAKGEGSMGLGSSGGSWGSKGLEKGGVEWRTWTLSMAVILKYFRSDNKYRQIDIHSLQLEIKSVFEYSNE